MCPWPGWTRIVVVGCVLVVAAVHAVQAAGTPEQLCQAAKNKVAAKYAKCRAVSEMKRALIGQDNTDALQKCDLKFESEWTRAEQKAVAVGTTCPSTGDQQALQAKTLDYTNGVAAVVAGRRFDDNGDGTITDNETGLQWEKKTTQYGSGANYADPHDVDNGYTWGSTSAPYLANGTVFTDFLAQLNGSLGSGTCFANHCDWRLPTMQELSTIAVPVRGGSYCYSDCIDPVFGPTGPNYWSATTRKTSSAAAWTVAFGDGAMLEPWPKDFGAINARAVRIRIPSCEYVGTFGGEVCP